MICRASPVCRVVEEVPSGVVPMGDQMVGGVPAKRAATSGGMLLVGSRSSAWVLAL